MSSLFLTRDLLKLDMVAGVSNDVGEYDSTTDDTGEQVILSSSVSLICQWESIRRGLVSDLCFEKLMKAISISQKRCLKLWNGKDEESESILRNQSFTSLYL